MKILLLLIASMFGMTSPVAVYAAGSDQLVLPSGDVTQVVVSCSGRTNTITSPEVISELTEAIRSAKQSKASDHGVMNIRIDLYGNNSLVASIRSSGPAFMAGTNCFIDDSGKFMGVVARIVLDKRAANQSAQATAPNVADLGR